MIVYDVTGTENHPVYNGLEVSNLERQYDFLQSITNTALALRYQGLSLPTIKAFNYHAIASLHRQAGELRTEPVVVETDGRVEYTAPPPSDVPHLIPAGLPAVASSDSSKPRRVHRVASQDGPGGS